MADPVVIYPEDFTGQAASNRIVGEQIIITAPGDRRYHTAMPKFAPMYEKGLTVFLRRLDGVIIELHIGIDFYMSHKFGEASLATMHPIYGSISFLRRDIVGTLIVNYQTLGGDWTIDEQKILEILANQTRNPRVTAWEQVANPPREFPVVNHPWNLDDMVGQKEILEILERFYLAFVASLDPNGGGGALAAHLADLANPHQTTPAKIGAYTTQQVDQLLTHYLAANGIAFDSTRLGGKLLAEVMQDVVGVKVSRATAADTSGTAAVATKANDSDRLAGQTLQQIVDMINQSTGSNALKFNGKTYEEVRTDYMSGTAANSNKLGGKTLAEIMSDVASAGGDAQTLQGRSYQQIMDAVVVTKVGRATRADNATNSDQLGGKNLATIMSEMAMVVPDLANNSSKVYGLGFDELAAALSDSDFIPYGSISYPIEGIVVENPNTGGTADPLYNYALIADVPVPLTGDGTKWDSTVRSLGSALSIQVFFRGHTDRMRAVFTTDKNTTGYTKYASDFPMANNVRLGVRIVPSGIFDAGGVEAKKIQLWIKVLKSMNPREYSIFQYQRNSVRVHSDDTTFGRVTNHTLVELNSVVWEGPTAASGSDPDLRDDTQNGFDHMADTITTLTAVAANPA